MAIAPTLPQSGGMSAAHIIPKLPSKLFGVLFAVVLAAFALTPQQAEAHHKGRIAAGIVAGAIVAGALAHHHHKRRYYYNHNYHHGSGYYYQKHHHYQKPRYHYQNQYYHSGRPAPWTPAWYRYCSAKYRSFDPRSGTFQPYHGHRRLCR